MHNLTTYDHIINKRKLYEQKKLKKKAEKKKKGVIKLEEAEDTHISQPPPLKSFPEEQIKLTPKEISIDMKDHFNTAEELLNKSRSFTLQDKLNILENKQHISELPKPRNGGSIDNSLELEGSNINNTYMEDEGEKREEEERKRREEGERRMSEEEDDDRREENGRRRDELMTDEEEEEGGRKKDRKEKEDERRKKDEEERRREKEGGKGMEEEEKRPAKIEVGDRNTSLKHNSSSTMEFVDFSYKNMDPKKKEDSEVKEYRE